MTKRDLAFAIVEYLRRDDRTYPLVRPSDMWAFEEAIEKAIEEIQREASETRSCCAFCEG